MRSETPGEDEGADAPRYPGVSGHRGPLSSPWTTALPKTVAEARTLGEHLPEGVEKPLRVETFLHTWSASGCYERLIPSIKRSVA